MLEIFLGNKGSDKTSRCDFICIYMSYRTVILEAMLSSFDLWRTEFLKDYSIYISSGGITEFPFFFCFICSILKYYIRKIFPTAQHMFGE